MSTTNSDFLPLIENERPAAKTKALYAITIICLILVAILATASILLAVRYGQELKRNELPVYPQKSSASALGKYKVAGLTADNVFCSEIGRDILIKGGNAVDAMIAMVLCIGVMNPQSSGIGGGHFMTIYNATTRKCNVVDARETAPAKANETMYIGKPLKSQVGWKAIGVPGELHGLRTEYEHFGGQVPWRTLFEPTIARLKDGIPVSAGFEGTLKEEWPIIKDEPTLKYILTKNGDGKTPLKTGDIMRTRTKLTETLQFLADSDDPIKDFYDGEMTDEMVAEFQKNDGLIIREDFANYRSIIRNDRDVIYTKLIGDRAICGPPPPSSSAVTQSILKIIDGYDFDQTTFEGNVDLYHRFIEASKFAYAYRSRMGDMAFVKDAKQLADNITSDQFAHAIRAKITDKAHPISYYGGKFYVKPDHGTTHLTSMDKWGNTVSVTTTVNLFFGARVRSESTGVIWNCQMDDFSIPGHPNSYGFPPSPANFIKPGKRPQSSISPLVFFNERSGDPLMAIGGAGGAAIISGVSTVAFRSLWLDWDLKKAVDAPRFHNQLLPNITQYENGFPPELLRALRNRGQVMEVAAGLNCITATQRKGDFVFANSDYRKGSQSQCAGY